MITRGMIEDGFYRNIVSINDESDWLVGICCIIGEQSFYFLGEESDQSLEEFWESYTLNEVIDMIYDILKDVESAENNGIYSDDLEYYESVLNGTKRFTVDIIETYKRTVHVSANNEDEAYDIINERINNGAIDLPCDGDGYEYGRELFVNKNDSKKGSKK